MTIITPASALPDNWERRRRPEPFVNTTSETVPPYACMQIKGMQETAGRITWRIGKCDAGGASRQNPSEFLFNGPVPIPSGRPGVGMSGFPCKVLQKGSSLSLFAACGPVSGQWYVRSPGTAFTFLGNDEINPVAGGTIRTIWIQRGAPAQTSGIPFVNDSGETIPPYAPMWNADDGIVVDGGTAYVDCAKPGTTFDVHWLVNGGSAVSDQATSRGFWRFEDSGPVAVDEELDGLVQVGDELGVVPGEWFIGAGRLGFIALGPTRTQDDVLVVDCRQRVGMPVLVRAAADGTQDSDGAVQIECEIMMREPGQAPSSAGWDNIDVYLTFQNDGETVAEHTLGWARRYGGGGATGWEGDFACGPSDVIDTGA